MSDEGALDDSLDTMQDDIDDAIEDMAEGHIPDRVRWRPVFLWKGLVFGILADVAIEVLFQQFGIAPLDAMAAVRGIALGTFIGIAAPSMGAAVGVAMVNREIGKLEREFPEAT